MGQIQTKQHVRREPELFQRKPTRVTSHEYKVQMHLRIGSMALEEE